MAKRCEICDKGTAIGRKISHAHNVTSRTFEANLHKVRALIDGRSRRIWACTRCIRSGRLQKPPARSWKPEGDAATS
jgi:large subunit ribosomal protein L28